ncbi:MAG: PAS domain-containing sensor histidine kinase [bacterium]|nr:PAS domain-containing sensor histidine kinase [bacterium]
MDREVTQTRHWGEDFISATASQAKHNKTLKELERYKLLVESVEDYAIFMLDTTGHVVNWNKGAQKLKGYEPNEIIGKHFSILYPEKDKKSKKPEHELEISLKEGRVEDEGWRIRKDGSRFWADVVITALYDDQAKHLGFAKVTRDLTERKKYEDTLNNTNTKLESSYHALEILSATKDEFISLASHQLRTPATGVKQYLGLLLEGFAGELTERQIDYLQKAYTSNDRQLEIVHDLLRVAQLDAGKVILNKFKINLGNLVADIIDEQIDSFKLRKQTVEFHNPQKLIEVFVDPSRFRMVLDNLIDNASKYTPDKGKIEVSIKEAKLYVEVAVSDTGVGIAPEDRPKLFEKFSRIQNEHTISVYGSGLGLYWAAKIIKLHDGEINVKSTVGKGSVFSVRIPKAAA